MQCKVSRKMPNQAGLNQGQEDRLHEARQECRPARPCQPLSSLRNPRDDLLQHGICVISAPLLLPCYSYSALVTSSRHHLTLSHMTSSCRNKILPWDTSQTLYQRKPRHAHKFSSREKLSHLLWQCVSEYLVPQLSVPLNLVWALVL